MTTATTSIWPDWMDRGACRGLDPDLFFPDRGDVIGIREARAVCATCPVTDECLAYALDHSIKFGVWGGVTERERRRMRRARQAAAVTDRADTEEVTDGR